MLDHVVIACSVVSGVLRFCSEEGFYVVQGCIERGSRGPSPDRGMGEVEITEKLLIVPSNLEVLSLVRHG